MLKVKLLQSVFGFIPGAIKAGGNAWAKFKTLSMKGKLITVAVAPFPVGAFCWLVDKYGAENVEAAIDALSQAIAAAPIN